MRYRTLGRTGVSVSVIGFGASALGNVFGQVSQATCERTVGAAIDSGINLFDVSPYYGMTLAEERLGAALAGRRGQVLLGTKCGRYGADQFDFSARTITERFEHSLRRLRTDAVDLLQAHDIEFGDLEQILNETLPAMERLRERGLVRYLGVTGYWPKLLARVAAQAQLDCVLNYCHANLFVDDMLPALGPVADQKGVGLLNASPLHMGLLGGKQVPAWHPAPEPVQAAAREVQAVCERYGVDAPTLALAACLGVERIASTFVGLASEGEVTAACAALDWVAPPGLLAEVERVIAPVHNTVWPSGLAQNSEVAHAAH